jgi:hypothetical protein
VADRAGGNEAGGRTAAVALALGVAAVLASWIPVAGPVLGAAAVALALSARRSARRAGGLARRVRVRSRRALGVGAFGLLLGLAFTVAWRACTPSVETPEERRVREEFLRAFEPPAAADGAGGGPGPGRNAPPAP